MRSRSARALLGFVAFFAPTYLAVLASSVAGSPLAESGWYTPALALAAVFSLAIGCLPALLLLRSGLPPNTRLGLAIVAGTLLIAECLSIAYIVAMSGTTEY